LAGSLTAVGAAAVGGALSGAIMAGLMGDNVWVGARRGAISGAISSWLGSVESGSSAGNAPTGNVELTSTQKWFNNAFGSFAANSGNYKFGAGDVLALCGAEDALNKAFSDPVEQAEVEENTEQGEINGSGLLDDLTDTHLQIDNDDPWYYYSQRDQKWANIPYSLDFDNNPKQTIGETACGPTSAAMAITKLTGQTVTPVTTAEYSLVNGYRTPNDGTYGAFFGAIGKEYGLAVKETTNFYEAKKYLQNNPNSVVVASMGPGHFTKGGHYVVLDSAKNFTTHVLDPYRSSNSHSWWDLTLAFEGKRYYIFTKK